MSQPSTPQDRDDTARFFAKLSAQDPDLAQARPALGEFPYFARSREILPNFSAELIAPGAEVVAVEGLGLCERIFTEHQPDAVDRLARTYRKLLLALPVESVPEDALFGQTIEWTAFFVYRNGGRPVAMGGLYRYVEQIAEFWLGRFGVVAEKRGTGLADMVLESLFGDAMELGGSRVLAFTEPHNDKAIRFYERHGMRRQDTKYLYAGSHQVVLSRELSGGQS